MSERASRKVIHLSGATLTTLSYRDGTFYLVLRGKLGKSLRPAAPARKDKFQGRAKKTYNISKG